MLFGIDDDVAGLEFALLTQCFGVFGAVDLDPRAVIQVFRVTRWGDREQICRVIGLQDEHVLTAGNFFDHD